MTGGTEEAVAVQDEVVLELCDVSRHFQVGGGIFGGGRRIKAVDGVSLSVRRRETLALVGESGCGKSTLGRLALRLIEPTSGKVLLAGRDLTSLKKPQLRSLRRKMQIVFQDPFASLNPRMSVFDILAEPIRLHRLAEGPALEARVHELLRLVGLQPFHGERFPHEFSGGQRQRIGVARALSTNPALVVCDEPVSALDVSIQAQVVNLLHDLQASFGLAYLFIAHDLAVVKHIADRVAVMYLGRIVELAPKKALYSAPRHPYTQALLAAAPRPDPTLPRGARVLVQGDPASPLAPPTGCSFHPRCSFAEERCARVLPILRPAGNGSMVACHRAEEIPQRPPEPLSHPSEALARRLLLLTRPEKANS
ncbi:AppF ABC-type oligopeptide transport system, ATPase component [Rhabdaerophilaceae bacterium]